MKPTSPEILNGSCQCGNVTYRITGKPTATAACHCTECQKLSGGAFSMSTLVNAADFELTSGKPACWLRKADSGRTIENWFCSRCGNRIYHRTVEDPSIIRVKPGTLDHRPRPAPVVHVWFNSRQRWLKLAGGAARVSAQPASKAEVIRALVVRNLTRLFSLAAGAGLLAAAWYLGHSGYKPF